MKSKNEMLRDMFAAIEPPTLDYKARVQLLEFGLSWLKSHKREIKKAEQANREEASHGCT